MLLDYSFFQKHTNQYSYLESVLENPDYLYDPRVLDIVADYVAHVSSVQVCKRFGVMARRVLRRRWWCLVIQHEPFCIQDQLIWYRMHRFPFGSWYHKIHPVAMCIMLWGRVFYKIHNTIKLDQQVDVASLHKEIEHREHKYLWFVNLVGARKISKRGAVAIVLKRPGAGQHQLTTHIYDQFQRTAYESHAEHFPQTISFVEDFAKKNNAILGRVSIASLGPGERVPHHTDSIAPTLRGFDRYHLVVQAGERDYFTCGAHASLFQTGDLFFLDNHTIHAAHNMSTRYWRIHLIIDIRPLDGSGRGRQVSDLSDWRWFDGNS